jgi:TATA-box binding protein (TBP) (component of TFIID and TFIIIB)
MKLKNIKASFIFGGDLQAQSTNNNVFKMNGSVFTIYNRSPKLLNVTGVKSLVKLKECKGLMEKHFNQPVIKVRIDNAFFSRKDNKNIDLEGILKYMKGNDEYFVSYNPESYTVMIFQPKNKEFPTILLFHTGSFILMGGKSLSTIYKTEIFVKNIINKFEKTLNSRGVRLNCVSGQGPLLVSNIEK